MSTNEDTDDESNGEYRYMGRSPWRRGDEYVNRGDVVEPSESELEAFSDLLTPLDTGEGEEATGDVVTGPGEADASQQEPGEVIPWDGYDDMTVADIRESLGEYAAETIAAAIEYEYENESRSTAISAMQDELESRTDDTSGTSPPPGTDEDVPPDYAAEDHAEEPAGANPTDEDDEEDSDDTEEDSGG